MRSNSIWAKGLALGIAFAAAAGCAQWTEVSVDSFEVLSPKIKPDAALKRMTQILVDRGFDLKMTNADAGIVTTEYKKFASSGGSVTGAPPFDYFLQIRATVKEKGGATVVTLKPGVKEVNRANAAAFTEHELTWCEDPGHDICPRLESMRQGEGWQWLGQAAFMNVVSDTASAFGLTVEDVTRNEVRTPKTGIDTDPTKLFK